MFKIRSYGDGSSSLYMELVDADSLDDTESKAGSFGSGFDTSLTVGQRVSSAGLAKRVASSSLLSSPRAVGMSSTAVLSDSHELRVAERSGRGRARCPWWVVRSLVESIQGELGCLIKLF